MEKQILDSGLCDYFGAGGFFDVQFYEKTKFPFG